MKSFRRKIPVKLGFFGSPKPQYKQSFVGEIGILVQDAYNAAEGHKNLRARSVIDDAGYAAVSLIDGLWEDPDKLKDVSRFILVYVEFNNDYTDWGVIVQYGGDLYGGNPPKQDYMASPNYDDAMEAERKELLERYGFKEETDNRQWVVSFSGMKAEMNSDELRKFKAEVGPGGRYSVREKTKETYEQ